MAFVSAATSTFNPRAGFRHMTAVVTPLRRAPGRHARVQVRASIEQEVSQNLKEAMKAKDTERLKALRTIRAAFLTAMKAEGAGDSLSDKEAITTLRKLAKMRQESIEMFEKGGRNDLAQAEREELTIIEHWLPKLASEEQIAVWAKSAVEKTGASKPSDMGKIMGYVPSSRLTFFTALLLCRCFIAIPGYQIPTDFLTSSRVCYFSCVNVCRHCL